MTEADIDSAITEARSRWPDVVVARNDFARTCDQCDPEAAHLVELILTSACLAGSPTAATHFEREFLSAARAIAVRLTRDDTERDEMLQLLRVRLLIGDGRPRLAEYHGRGSLLGWVKAVATRVGLNELKHRSRLEHRETATEAVPDIGLEQDPAFRAFVVRHQVDFQQALASGWQKLTPRQRTILKMNTIDRISIDRIGAVYGVHRGSAARWLERAREELLDVTRELLAQRLSISPSELHSVLRGLGSDIDVSIRSVMMNTSDE